MGHRTNYAIRRDGRVRLFYSHWGALTVPQDVFWGPKVAEEFISRHEEIPNDAWLDDVFGEGGVALDMDTHTIALFGGEALGYPPLQPVFAELMAALWAGWDWSVRFVDAMPDIAEQVGFDRGIAESEPLPPMVFSVDQLVANWNDHPFIAGILTVLSDDAIDDRLLSASAGGALGGGPQLLARARELPTIDDGRIHHNNRDLESWEQERPLFGDQFSSGAVIDTTRKCIGLWEIYLPERDLAHIEQQWQGWTVERYTGLDTHFERSGRPLAEGMAFSTWEGMADERPEMNEDEILAEIATCLLAEKRADPTEAVRQMMAQHEAEGSESWTNPDALKSPIDARPGPGTRREIFNMAVAELVKRRL